MAVNTVSTIVFAGLASIIVGNDAASTNYVGIHGGHEISIEEAPFMASLWLDGSFHCGASIINERFILTAAHCVILIRVYKVKIGISELNEEGSFYEVEKIIKHELFNYRNPDYDVGLIKLKTDVPFSAKVNKIALADATFVLVKDTEVEVTGWGATENAAISKELQQVTVPIISQSICNTTYLEQGFLITDRMICAGEEGKDSCSGDSGGPLTLNNVQVGITSFGLGCGRLPGVYTKISAVLSWITDTIEKNL